MSQTKAATTKQTNNSVLRADQLNVNLMSITVPRKRNDKFVSYLLQNNEPVYSMTPWSYAVFGVSKFIPKQQGGSNLPQQDKGTGQSQWSINLSARSYDEKDTELVESYFNQWKEVDELMISHAVQHSEILGLGKTKKGGQASREVLEALYTSVVKTDPAGKFPVRLQPKIMKARDRDGNELENVPDIKLYQTETDGSGLVEIKLSSFDDLVDTVPKNSFVRAVLQPRVWYIAGKFGLSLQVVQLLVMKKKNFRPTDCVFGSVTESSPVEKTEEQSTDMSVERQQYNSDEDVQEDEKASEVIEEETEEVVE